MADGSGDPKRDLILHAAKDVFLRYGFSRTTMDDIARSAEISRPALYLHFRNKADIYRALAMQLLAEGYSAAREALRSDAPFEDRLVQAIRHGMLDLLDAVATSPHGPELMDAKESHAADVIEGWCEKMEALFAETILDEARANGVDLAACGFSADVLARMPCDVMEGIKQRPLPSGERMAEIEQLARLLGFAVGATSPKERA
jgi:AcrR family transcriptional regulator